MEETYEFDLNLAYCELKLAIRKCQESDFSKPQVKQAIELAQKLCTKVTTKKQKDELVELAQRLVTRHKEAEAKRALEGGTTVNPVPTSADLDQVAPIRYPVPLAENAIYNVSPIESKNNYQDNVILLYGPFIEELDYVAECYASKAKKPMRVLDFSVLVSQYRNSTAGVLASLYERSRAGADLVIVYKNVKAMEGQSNIETNFFYYMSLLRQNAKNVEQIILSDDIKYGVERKYSEFANERFKDIDVVNSYLKSINYSNVPLVPYSLTVGKLRQKFSCDDVTEELILKDGLFLGYKGLNDIILRVSDVGAMRGEIAKMAETRRATLDAFLEAYNGGYDLLDWSYKQAKKKQEKKKVVDPNNPLFNPVYKIDRDKYDGLIGNEEIYRKMEILLNRNEESLRLRCAWAAHFALDAGDILNVINLPPEKAELLLTERWQLAYHAVVTLLRLAPGKIVFDIPANSSTRGLCCDGGATIRMSKRFVAPKDMDDVTQGVRTLLHELFHAVQHKSIHAKNGRIQEVLDYYLVHLGIHNHIVEWEKNYHRYRQPEESFEMYEDQVFEASARIFAEDCLDEYGNFNPPKLA